MGCGQPLCGFFVDCCLTLDSVSVRMSMIVVTQDPTGTAPDVSEM
jgi:hypothetical protein